MAVRQLRLAAILAAHRRHGEPLASLWRAVATGILQAACPGPVLLPDRPDLRSFARFLSPAPARRRHWRCYASPPSGLQGQATPEAAISASRRPT